MRHALRWGSCPLVRRFLALKCLLLAWDEYVEHTGKCWSLRGEHFNYLFVPNIDMGLFG